MEWMSLRTDLMDKFDIVNGKKLRYGFTTGSCATAGAKAACEMLFNNRKVDFIKIKLINGELLNIEVENLLVKDEYVEAAIIKDAGDDPDITNGIEIRVQVRKIKETEINIIGGVGVGKVTKKGLNQAVGQWAINSGPRQMIKENLKEYIENKDFGVEVKVIVPSGEEVAKKTLNEKLGIIGGISILGSTGIVRPMSEEAFKKSLDIELSVLLKEKTSREVYFSFGNYGKKFAMGVLKVEEKNILITSNFIGYMLESAGNQGVTELKIIGNLGKVIKVAGGIFHTHNRVADGRMEILTANALLLGERQENLLKIMNANTCEEAIEYIENRELFNFLSDKVKEKCEAYLKRVGYNMNIEVLIFSNEYGELGRSKKFYE